MKGQIRAVKYQWNTIQPGYKQCEWKCLYHFSSTHYTHCYWVNNFDGMWNVSCFQTCSTLSHRPLVKLTWFEKKNMLEIVGAIHKDQNIPINVLLLLCRKVVTSLCVLTRWHEDAWPDFGKKSIALHFFMKLSWFLPKDWPKFHEFFSITCNCTIPRIPLAIDLVMRMTDGLAWAIVNCSQDYSLGKITAIMLCYAD